MTANPTRLQALVEGELGLSIERGGIASALTAYARRKAVSLGTDSEESLAAHVKADDASFNELVEAVTVPHTWFFRDLEQLEGAAAFLAQRASRTAGPPRVWVPACASGDEAYSLAALVAERNARAEIVGTDVNLAALQRARQGAYGAWAVRWVPERMKHVLAPRAGSTYEIAASLKGSVSFVQHNLLHAPLPSTAADGLWDLIVCRNVLIYLTREHARRVIEHLRQALSPGGALILGASDIVFELPAGLTPVSIDNRLVFLRQEGAVPQPAAATPEPLALGFRIAAMPPQPAVGSRELVAIEPSPAYTSSVPPSQKLDEAPAAESDDSAAAREMLDGISRYLDGDVQGAARQLRAALFLEANLWPAAYYLALCYDAIGLGRDAKRLYGRVAELIASGAPLPIDTEHGFRFLEQDVLRIARARGARGRP
ncbi:MAG: hypothetical protein HY898_13760 [Deltaproteobacteria bacterium]|nr:hypothetical protein [Deltaproteobacteria bacterium]